MKHSANSDSRDFYFDNAKFILILLVVLGHYASVYTAESAVLGGIYNSIYSFHMPLFIFISGFFSKNIRHIRFKDVEALLYPYIVIQLLYLLAFKIAGVDADWSIAIPIGPNWYLLALFFYRLTIPLIRHIRYPLLTSIILAIAIGYFYDFDKFLNTQRIIAFMPFFVLGYFAAPSIKQYVSNRQNKLLFLFLILSVTFGFILLSHYFPQLHYLIEGSFIPNVGYLTLGDYQNFGAIFRLAFFLIAFFMSYMFLRIVPHEKTWFTQCGEQTLHIFLFHMFAVYFISLILAYKPIISEAIAIPFVFLVSIILFNKRIMLILDLIIRSPNQWRLPVKPTIDK